MGTGSEVEIDPSGLNPGTYSVQATTQDAYQHSASCTIHFQVILPADSIQMACSAEPTVVEQGQEAIIHAQASDALGHPLRYRWFANGGALREDGAEARLDTSGLMPGDYTVTGRADDDRGLASDCSATLKVELPVLPPVPPQPSDVAQIVFVRNQSGLDPARRAQLEKVLGHLNADPEGRVSIEGYAGPDENHPSQLAAERTSAVRRFFIENGVPESRIQTVVGQGGGRGGLRNRTVDVIWLPKGLEY